MWRGGKGDEENGLMKGWEGRGVETNGDGNDEGDGEDR